MKDKVKIYYKDRIEMNGRGITKVVFNDEKETFDRFVEGLLDDISSREPDFIDNEVGIYIGNASAWTYDIMFDAKPEVDLDKYYDILDKLYDVEFIKEGDKMSSKKCIRKIAKDVVCGSLQKNSKEKETIFEMPHLDISDILTAYVGKPDKCMCGCSGTYYYPRVNAEVGSKDRGYKVKEDEINDDKVMRIYRKMSSNAKMGIEVLDGHIFTLIAGNTQYTIYKKK